MFDTMKVARTIKEARIAQNMTQMNLADAMEVSYQAVSNWERGNSMPDIAKLEQLCQLLHISIEELLGTDNASRTLTKIIYRDNVVSSDPDSVDTMPGHTDNTAEEPASPSITMEEIQDIAPLLPPNDIERLVDDNVRQNDQKLSFSVIMGMAPFLDSDYLDSLVKRAQINSLQEVTALAPFLSENALDTLVMNFQGEVDMSGILSLAPFLSESALNRLVMQNPHVGSLQEMTALAPFLSPEALDALIMNSDLESNISDILSLAPFLSENTLDKLTDRLLEDGHSAEIKKLTDLCPFLSGGTVRKIAKHLMRMDDLDTLQLVVPFL